MLVKQSLRIGLITGLLTTGMAIVMFPWWGLNIVWPLAFWPMAFVPLFITGVYAVHRVGRLMPDARRAALAGGVAGLAAAVVTVAAIMLLSILGAMVVPPHPGPSLWSLAVVLMDSPFFVPPKVLFFELPRPLPFPWVFNVKTPDGVLISRVPWTLPLFLPLGALLAALQAWLYHALGPQTTLGLRTAGVIARRRASFQVKLLVGFFSLGLMIFVVGWLGFAATNQMHVQTHAGRARQHWLDHVLRVQHNLRAQSEAFSRLSTSPNEAVIQDVSTLGKQIGAELNHLKTFPPPAHAFESVGAIGSALFRETEKRLPAVRAVDSRFNDLNKATLRLIELYRGGNGAEAHALLASLEPLQRAVTASLWELTNDLNVDLTRWMADTDDTSHGELLAIMLLVLLATGIAFPLGYVFSQVVVRPVTEVSRGLARVGSGDFSTKVRVENRDEFGELAEYVNKMSAELDRLYAELRVLNEHLEQKVQELTELLAQQTATSEVLKTISRSTLHLEPVLDALIENATRLCAAEHGVIFTFDGEFLHPAADHGASPALTDYWRRNPIRPGPAPVSGRAALERLTVHVHDLMAEPGQQHQGAMNTAGVRTVLAVPMLREGLLLGVISIWKTKVEPFTDKQIELVTTFADEAVITIENVRLFKELEARTAQLSRSVEELRALGEVGRAVSSTLDLETVLATIVARANQLAGTDACSVFEYDERAEEFHVRATSNLDEAVVAVARRTPIGRGEGVQGLMAMTLEPVQVPDIGQEGAYSGPLRDVLLRTGTRALLAVPLMREGHLIGGLTVNKKTPGEFSPEVIDLLKTFASQSALAIQNARLFRELEEKSRQLEIASRHKSDFLASVSHELRTPMNAILGFNEMILGGIYGEVSAELKAPLTDIQDSGKHLLRLINNVLDLSKIEAGRMELALGDYSVQETVERVKTSLRSLAEEKGLDFVTAVPEDVPLARGDVGRITQCLMNLAGNALKFTRQGRVEISVDRRGDVLTYRVADTGIGIARDQLETVFGEYRQGDPLISSEFGGSGLGLSITKKFVEMHGGRVWVESELGKGSTFAFEIPLRVDGAKTG
jgi:signal transduction histidine kinase/HAMP domain-containing protein